MKETLKGVIAAVLAVLLIVLAVKWSREQETVLSVVSTFLSMFLVVFSTLKWSKRYYKGLSTILLWVAGVLSCCALVWLRPAGAITDCHLYLLFLLTVVLGLWNYLR